MPKASASAILEAVARKTSPTVTLVAVPTIAEMLGLSRQRVYQLSRTKGFPDPDVQVAYGSGQVIRAWRRSVVVRWAKAHGRTIYPVVL